MDSLESSLVLTKLRVPAPRSRLVHRDRLTASLISGEGQGCVLVCAPAGYGKTTLLADWARCLLEQNTAVAWYALDAGDDDPNTFGAYLVASLAQAVGAAPELVEIAQRLRSSPDMDFRKILQSIINTIARYNKPSVLVLDDYHLISSPAIHTGMAFLIDHLPEGMRVIIGSRSDPPLPLARMRARGQLQEIRSTQLRFTTEETALFLNHVMELDLSPAGITEIGSRSEGWVTGLQLAALSLAGKQDKERLIAAFGGSNRYLVDYLMEEVFNSQAEEAQSFLLATSVLERMCAPLCNALLGDGVDSGAILEKLDQANLFVVAIDDECRWYRYHHLFRDFLRSRLEKQPGRTAALHRLACAWLEATGLLREAAYHAQQSADLDYGAAFVARHSGELIIRGEITTLYEWCSAFPEEYIAGNPQIGIPQCWALVFSYQRRNRAKIEQRLREAEQAISAMGPTPEANELAQHAAVVRTFLALTPDPTLDPDEYLARAEQMLADPEAGEPGYFGALLMVGYAQLARHKTQAALNAIQAARETAVRARMYFGLIESTFHLARLVCMLGNPALAARICHQGREELAEWVPDPDQNLPAVGALDIALGCVLLEQDHLPEAEQNLVKGLRLIGAGANPFYLITANTALARLYAMQNQMERATACLTRIEDNWPDLAFFAQGRRLALDLRGSLPSALLVEADAWCQQNASLLGENTFPPGAGPFGAAEFFYQARLDWVRLQVYIGHLVPALAVLEQQLEVEQANGLTARVVELLLIKAQAASAGGDQHEAMDIIEQALALAQPAGYIRIFDQRAGLTELLRAAANQGMYREYLEYVLTALGTFGPRQGPEPEIVQFTPTDTGLVESLSQRELEVLCLMAQGATNQAIADRLVITVGTVKSHINHILGKLGAKNRTEAVAIARGLHLIQG